MRCQVKPNDNNKMVQMQSPKKARMRKKERIVRMKALVVMFALKKGQGTSALKQWQKGTLLRHLESTGDGPSHFFRRRHGHRQVFSRDWVLPGKMCAHEVQSLSGEQGRSPIDCISNDGVAHGRGVPSDLMCPARMQVPFQKGGAPMYGPIALAQVLEIRP
jgi:hypothetical protein